MNIQMRILDSRLDNEVNFPAHATPGAAALDLVACISGALYMEPGDVCKVPSGFALAIPEGYAALLIPRSGRGTNEGLVLAHTAGLIDSDYRGEILIPLFNRGSKCVAVWPMERVCQMIIMPVARASFTVVQNLDETARGAGGFGSTGVHASGSTDLQAALDRTMSVVTYKQDNPPPSILKNVSEGVHPSMFSMDNYMRHWKHYNSPQGVESLQAT